MRGARRPAERSARGSGHSPPRRPGQITGRANRIFPEIAVRAVPGREDLANRKSPPDTVIGLTQVTESFMQIRSTCARVRPPSTPREDDIIPAMPAQWSYADLTIMSTSNAQNDDYAHHAASVAFLTDARGVRVLAVWDPDPMAPQLLYAVMDEAGKEGWIVGEPSSVQFEPQGPMAGRPVRITGPPSVPAWIKEAARNVEGLGEWSRGYYHYPLRRTHD
jgi:hypothetical protein